MDAPPAGAKGPKTPRTFPRLPDERGDHGGSSVVLADGLACYVRLVLRRRLVSLTLATACAPVAAPSTPAPAVLAPASAGNVSPRPPEPAVETAPVREPVATTTTPQPAQPFPPPDIEPPSIRSAEPGDGQWKPLGESPPGGAAALLYTALIHPHVSSRFITLSLVAIDLTRARIEFVPGVDDVVRQQVPFVPGLVPERDRAGLVAAFNGGFMPQHGRWGMRVGETTLLPPREPGCTIALTAADRVEIRSWPALASRSGELRALRQTPPCLLEEGEVHPDLIAGRERAWAGHTPGIVTRRRSALGVSKDGKTLLYALGVECSPKLLATGLRAAGAASAAQLDINWNWTRFLLFAADSNGKPRVTTTLAEVDHTKRDYVEAASKRDFFYVVRRD